MNKDGTFETRGHLLMALLKGSMVQNTNCSITIEFSNDYFHYTKDGITESLETIPKIHWPENWRILKPKKRRVIKDRAKLVRVLLDMGYTLDDNGDFAAVGLPYFTSIMWKLCGRPVKKYSDKQDFIVYTDGGYDFPPDWTEEYEEEEE